MSVPVAIALPGDTGRTAGRVGFDYPSVVGILEGPQDRELGDFERLGG